MVGETDGEFKAGMCAPDPGVMGKDSLEDNSLAPAGLDKGWPSFSNLSSLRPSHYSGLPLQQGLSRSPG